MSVMVAPVSHTTVQQATPPPAAQVFGMWQGSLVTQMLRVAAEYDLFGRLRDAPCTSADLAAATDTHRPSLHRLLRALAGLGLLRSVPDGWELTPLGGAALELGNPAPWAEQAFAELGRTIASGRPGMELSHACTVFEYLAGHPDDAAAFDRFMSVLNAGEAEAVASAYDFSGTERLVDVGGGNGALLVEVLRRWPALCGVLFDLPQTVATPAPEVETFVDRCEIVGGDFFAAVPTGADAYLVSHVIHDWDEPRALAILQRIREAIASVGRLLVVEMVMPTDDAPHPAQMLDMTMLALTGGRERTEDEYADLLARAGFRLERVIPTRSSVSVLEAVPC
jgi:hypothetical protein